LDKGAIDTSERFSLSRFFVDTEKEKEVDLIPRLLLTNLVGSGGRWTDNCAIIRRARVSVLETLEVLHEITTDTTQRAGDMACAYLVN